MADALRITAPPNLPSLVRTAFSRAAANGDLTYYQTQVAILTPGSIPPFQLRFSPSLASKPKNTKPQQPKDKPAAPFNPFADPDPALLIARLPQPATHTLVLNKFAIVPGHFILITNDFKPQTHLLEADDLEAAYACIRAYREDAAQRKATVTSGGGNGGGGEEEERGSDLFVFFNSGPFSGASQPHRHLQLLPIQNMKVGLPPSSAPTSMTASSSSSSDPQGPAGSDEWTPLIDSLHPDSAQEEESATTISRRRRCPFEIFSTPITPQMSAQERHAAYIQLYRRACAAVQAFKSPPQQTQKLPPPPPPPRQAESPAESLAAAGEEAQISYNLAMTSSVLALCPRLAEGSVIYDDARGGTGDGSGDRPIIGKIELNGTVLAGTALVKSQAEWDAVRKNPGLLLSVLEKIGIPTQDARPIPTTRELSL
ncbi:HIT-like domain-containing protein [Microdochium trichocladiopsis]|uniref:HIT-like domain-containing protein n=1 Tax=Microdochium trichocladiopsis TaxID=1682393 RepID=A0A9P8YDZ2_9PEZI|nr:HIT-like domain-containing protein [Microdochium trichocladiopsis]KAH7037700.1 HIT-like domain-containing protein [Microdochium trichocladiopsis]